MIVSIAADKYANGRRVSVSTEPVVHERDVKTKFASMLRLELPRFKLDDDVTQLLNMKEQQIEIKVIAGNIEMHLAAHESEPSPKLAESVHDPVHQRLFQVAFGRVFGQIQKVEDVRVFRDLPGQIGIGGRQLGAEV